MKVKRSNLQAGGRGERQKSVELESLMDSKYSSFDQINGNHRFKEAVPDGYVEYQVRLRKGGSIAYFNFALAKEMGLIEKDHPEKINSKLEKKLLETFSLIIINEYDLLNKKKFPKDEIRPNRYMATRYLQLQHRDKRGTTSGDGRSIWNGEFRKQGKTWDVSSSGTGATRLSPACALEGKFFKTGDSVGYGDGYSSLDEGLSAALMSEIFSRNGIETERILLIISFKAGSAINVRAAKSLLRPSHFFCHLKQANYKSLKSSIDFFIERQIENKEWPEQLREADRLKKYGYFTNQIALTFSKMAALFESNYIFCWLDWDGDNILAQAGIIDYGSVRKFGLYHHQYRYDDIDRYSTSISEQRIKARRIVQVFAQIRSYLISGNKLALSEFNHDPLLRRFDRNFSRVWNNALLKKMGFRESHRNFLLEHHLKAVKQFRGHYRYFERAQSSRGIHKVADGISSDAIFSMTDILRELPKKLAREPKPLEPKIFIDLIRSSYARKKDLKLSPYRRGQSAQFQKVYLHLVQKIADRFFSGESHKVLVEMGMRSSVINQKTGITGDGVLEVTGNLIKAKKRLTRTQFYKIFKNLIENQTSIPINSDQILNCAKKISRRTQVGLLTLKGLQWIRDYSQSI